MCDKEYTWNPSNCECECDKSCDVGVYLDYENCKCKKKLINKLVDECTETIEEAKLDNIIFAKTKNSSKCISGIVTDYVYSQWYLKKGSPCVDLNTKKETTI